MTGVSCPECGRQVPPQSQKLCPHCGYPLMLDRRPAVEETAQKIVHKPLGPGDTGASFTLNMPHPAAPPAPAPQPPPQQYLPPRPAQAFGPLCPACQHVNPPPRKRCEVCGAELWPGSATPSRWMPEPPAVPHQQRRRGSWWRTALAIGVPIAIMGIVWALALWL